MNMESTKLIELLRFRDALETVSKMEAPEDVTKWHVSKKDELNNNISNIIKRSGGVI